MAQEFLPRQTAAHCSIAEIQEAEFLKSEESMPNFILFKSGEKASRVNVMAIAVSIPSEGDGTLIVDDGTSKIVVRAFERTQLFENITIGDPLLIIGKPRMYNDEKYIIPEIIKKIRNKGWMELRKKELAKVLKPVFVPKPPSLPQVEKEKEQLPESKIIYELIRTMDKGEGIETEEVIKKSPFPAKTESVITALLLEGEIFEIRPGKLKVL